MIEINLAMLSPVIMGITLFMFFAVILMATNLAMKTKDGNNFLFMVCIAFCVMLFVLMGTTAYSINRAFNGNVFIGNTYNATTGESFIKIHNEKELVMYLLDIDDPENTDEQE